MEPSPNERIASWLLRISLAFAFLYAVVSAFFDPFSWIGFFPPLLRDLAPNDAFLLNSFGVLESLLALLLLFGRGLSLFLASLIATALLAGIVVLNWGAMDIVFRDVSLAGAALALAFLSFPRQRKAG